MGNLVELYQPFYYYRQLQIGDKIRLLSLKWPLLNVHSSDMDKEYMITAIHDCHAYQVPPCDTCVGDYISIIIGQEPHNYRSSCGYDICVVKDGRNIPLVREINKRPYRGD